MQDIKQTAPQNKPQCNRERLTPDRDRRLRTVSRINHRGWEGLGWGSAGIKALLRQGNVTLGPNVTLNTEKHENSIRIKAPKYTANATNRS